MPVQEHSSREVFSDRQSKLPTADLWLNFHSNVKLNSNPASAPVRSNAVFCRAPTSDRLRVGGEHEQFDEAQAERGVVVLPDDGGDEEDFAVAGQQQGPEEQAELQGPTPQAADHHPQEGQHATAESRQL